MLRHFGIVTEPSFEKFNPWKSIRHALAENFVSILKTECIHCQKIATFAEAGELIDNYIYYIYFYNNQRIQAKTKLTPLGKRCQFVA